MGRVFVRQTVAAWFQPPQVAGLYTVYAAIPRRMLGQDFFASAPAGTPSGCVMAPHIEEQSRRRIVLHGATPGGKMADYTVALLVRFASNQQSLQSTQPVAPDATDDHDAIIDAIVARLELDKTLGTAGLTPNLFMAGEGDTYAAPDIHVHSQIPRLSKNMITIWSSIRFRVLEYAS